MNERSDPWSPWIRRAAAALAILFGLATLAAGARIASGRVDPGYVVFSPLLYFNTGMGALYVAAGILALRSLRWGRNLAGAIVLLNLAALGALLGLYGRGQPIAVESLGAMTFRAAVWLGLFGVLILLHRRSRPRTGDPRRPSTSSGER
jgi:hypothetical protein